MTNQTYQAVVVRKGNIVASRQQNGGNRMSMVVQFLDGSQATVWGGGATPERLKELTFMQQVQLGATVDVIQKFDQNNGQSKFFLAGSTYAHVQAPVQVQPQASPFPVPQSPAPYPVQGQVPQQAAAYPGQFAQPAPPPVATPQPQPPAPQMIGNIPNSVRPLTPEKRLQAVITLKKAADLWQMAYVEAQRLIHGAGVVDDHGHAGVRLATSLFDQVTPWKLGNESFDVGEYIDPLHGQLRVPMEPDKLIESLRRVAASVNHTLDEHGLVSLRTMVRIALGDLFPVDAVRHAFTQTVFGVSSTNDLQPGQLSAIASWTRVSEENGYTVSPVAVAEAWMMEKQL